MDFNWRRMNHVSEGPPVKNTEEGIKRVSVSVKKNRNFEEKTFETEGEGEKKRASQKKKGVFFSCQEKKKMELDIGQEKKGITSGKQKCVERGGETRMIEFKGRKDVTKLWINQKKDRVERATHIGGGAEMRYLKEKVQQRLLL